MMLDNHHITILSSNRSKNIFEISLSHKIINDLFGEVKTVFDKRKVATIYATIHEKGEISFRERVDVEGACCRVIGVPYRIAVSNAQNQLVAKLKKMMQEVALTREVDPGEQESFTRMLANTCKAFPNISREQGMHLVLDALKAKHRRQPAGTDDDAEFALE